MASRAAMSGGGGSAFPVAVVVLGILAIWYVAAVALNSAWALDQAGRDGVTLSAR